MTTDNLTMKIEDSYRKRNGNGKPDITIVSGNDYTDELLKGNLKYKNKVILARELARAFHEGQLRLSGEPVFDAHLVPIDESLPPNSLDIERIFAYLHDAFEDTKLNKGLVNVLFGLYALHGLELMTKDKPEGWEEYNTKRHWQYALFDPRFRRVTLRDRLINTRTIEYLPEDRQEAILLETFFVCAPIAYELGDNDVGEELENTPRRILKIPKKIEVPEHMMLRYIS